MPEQTREIMVKTNTAGAPLGLARNGRRDRVTAVYEHWRVADEWWGKEVKRDYFRLKTAAGLVCDIYHDTAAGRWYLDKVHD